MSNNIKEKNEFLGGVFIINKRIVCAALAAAICISPISRLAFAADKAVDVKEMSVIEGGVFEVAKLRPERITEEYRLSKYDVINVLVVGFPNGIGVNDIMVGVDGYAQIPYVGSVKLSGLTVPEATDLLTELMGEYIKIPDMSVIIKSYGPRKIYVMGEVNSPGIKDMPLDSLNAYAAISSAGGIAKRGRPKHVQVLRTKNDTMYYKEINIDDFVKEHDMTQNIALEDGDIVYVPSSNKIVFSEEIMPYVSMYSVYKNITD